MFVLIFKIVVLICFNVLIFFLLLLGTLSYLTVLERQHLQLILLSLHGRRGLVRCDGARNITGTVMTIDAGNTA